ncbi:ankyrin repeat and SOCS box protein 13 [Aplysia californica]|uniref:Ankyrin repeat and SOCS box protein 13 n=1 Tax=Aplysia californica TaxID=6500 RepID=A0ABM0JXX5_APLCA|nr:ankyrin repeat and SOCS box protein 13 [Aplysia californica]
MEAEGVSQSWITLELWQNSPAVTSMKQPASHFQRTLTDDLLTPADLSCALMVSILLKKQRHLQALLQWRESQHGDVAAFVNQAAFLSLHLDSGHFLESQLRVHLSESQCHWLWTPLSLAAHTDNAAATHLLLDQGAEVNRSIVSVRRFSTQGRLCSHDRWTPLHLACRAGSVQSAEMLLCAGADVNCLDSEDCPPLMRIGWRNCDDIVRLLLDHGSDVNVQCDRCETVMHTTLHDGNASVVEILVKAGADLCIADCEGLTPLTTAIINEQKLVVRALLRAGAGPDYTTDSVAPPLYLACVRGLHDIAADLLRHHADPNVTSPHREDTPLHCAIRKADTRLVKLLLQAGAQPTPCASTVDCYFDDSLLKSPLHEALLLGHTAIAAMLMKSGCFRFENVTSLAESEALALELSSAGRGECWDFLQCVAESAPRLEDMCRWVVSETVGFGANRRQSVRELPIPNMLQQSLISLNL